eukprot:gene16414-7818_t
MVGMRRVVDLLVKSSTFGFKPTACNNSEDNIDERTAPAVINYELASSASFLNNDDAVDEEGERKDEKRYLDVLECRCRGGKDYEATGMDEAD